MDRKRPERASRLVSSLVTVDQLGHGGEYGDCYTYVAMERSTKLVLTYHVDKRSSEGTWEFIDNLFFATSGRFQVSTDGYLPYTTAVPLIFRFNVDFSQVIKRFGGSTDTEAGRRYSPAAIISTQIIWLC
jgi:hypothetical protein